MNQNNQQATEESHERTYRRPDGTPKDTGRELHESIATVRVDETPADNPRVAIHVEHPDHDSGVRCFYRRRDGDVTRAIKSHLRTELDADLTRVVVIDEADVGVAEPELLPRRMARSTPTSPATEVEIRA